MNSETYLKKETRNQRARDLKAEGYAVKLRRLTGQIMHPQYVKDWPYPYETGFGNADYRTVMPTLYEVEFTK
jgi:hypothetical protein